MPVCLFLAKLPKKEIQILKAGLGDAWDSVDIEAPYGKDFQYVPWSEILGPSATLRQIYHLGKQANFQTGRSTCLLLDAMSGLSKKAYLAQYKTSDQYGPSLRLGEVRDLGAAPRYLVDHENGWQDSKKVYLEIILRDPDSPIEFMEEQSDRKASGPTPNSARFPIGAGMRDSVLPMVCIVKFDKHDLDNFQAKFCHISSLPSSVYVMVPWDRDEKATRAMMYSVATYGLKGDRDSERSYRYLVFLDDQTKEDGSMILSRFVNNDDTGGNDPVRRRLIIGRIPLSAFRHFWDSYEKYIFNPSKTVFVSDYTDEGACEEEIRNPDIPLSVRKPLYLHQGRWADTPAFFLARLSDADEAKVRKELETACAWDASLEQGKIFNYVPWAGTDDVKPVEQAVYIPRYMSYLTESSEYSIKDAIFVDARSPCDATVIIASSRRDLSDPTEYREDAEKIVTISWGRVDAQQAQSDCVNLGIANISWDEIKMMEEQRISTTQQERLELASLGKPFAEVGIWDDE